MSITFAQRPKTSRYAPHQSAREKARRVRQMKGSSAFEKIKAGLEDAIAGRFSVVSVSVAPQIVDVNTPADGRIAYLVTPVSGPQVRVYAANSASAKSRAEKAGHAVVGVAREIAP